MLKKSKNELPAVKHSMNKTNDETRTNTVRVGLVISGLYILCFVGIFMHLIEFDTVLYQSSRNKQNMISMLFFMIIIVIAQRARILRWQSLVVTLVYAPLAVLHAQEYVKNTPDLAPTMVMESVIIWIALMVILEMVITGRVRDIRQMNLPLLALYIVMTVLMVIQGNVKYVSINFLCVLLFLFVPIEKDEWKRIIQALFAAGAIAFVLAVVLSQIINPYVPGERWYGYFTNIGAFGEFLGLITALAVISILYSKDHFGRISIPYFLSWIWTVAVFAVAMLNGTTTYLVGVGLMGMVLLVFGFRKTRFPHLFIRAMVAIIVIGIMAVAMLYVVRLSGSSEAFRDRIEMQFAGTVFQKLFAGAYKVVEKIGAFRSSVNGERADYIQSSAMTFLHTFSSRRIGIFETYLRNTSFGTNGGGLWYHGYFAPGAHSQFVQVLYENGYLAGGLNILTFTAGWIASIVGYVRRKNYYYFVPMIVLSMMLGIWTGEVCAITYPVTFISLIVMTMVIVQSLPEKTVLKEGTVFPKRKKAIIIGAFSAAALFCIGFFVVKLARMNYEDARGAEKYLVVASASSEYLDKKETPEGNSDGDSDGVVIVNQDYVLQHMKTAAWGNRGYAVVSFDGVKEGDRVVLEFTAVSKNPELIPMRVSYENEISDSLEITNESCKYTVEYEGWPDKNTIVFIVDEAEVMQSPVEISEIKLINYGQP